MILSRIVTQWQGIQNKIGPGAKLLYAKAARSMTAHRQVLQKRSKLQNKPDVVIMSVGEASDWSGEAKSRSNLHLPGMQEELVKAIYATGKPVVVLINAGRPLIFNWTADHVPAILYTWWLGTEAGDAIADVLFGDYNPSAKLPISFPRTEGQIPIYYSYYNTGRPATSDSDRFYRSAYIDLSIYPKFPFGFGLSYTNFDYSNIVLSGSVLRANQPIKSNGHCFKHGKLRRGRNCAIIYTGPGWFRGTTRKRIERISKNFLKKGESKQVSFTIDVNKLRFYNAELKYIYEPGDFKLFIGGNSQNVKEASFKLQ